MNYTSSSPLPPSSPQAKLADRNWRWRNSWWIFAPIIGCGFLGFVGFLVAAIRTGKRHYWLSTAAYACTSALFIVFIEMAGEEGTTRYDVLTSIAVILFLIATFAPIIHAAVKNRDYLTTIAQKGQWYAQPLTQPAPSANPTSFMGVSNGDYFAAEQPAPSQTPVYPQSPASQPSAPSGASSSSATAPSRAAAAGDIHINQADAAELATSLGIDRGLSAQVVSARDMHGPFNDLDDLANKANLQPHQLIRFRNKVTFGPPRTGSHQDPTTRPTGRILDF